MLQPNPTFTKWLLLLLLNTLLHFSAIKSQPNCLNSETYESNSTYATNLNTLISSLSSNIGNSGFYNASVGQNPNRINAIVLCRGDTLLSDCQNCVNATAHELVRRCFNNKEAIFWNETCLVRYSNNPIFGVLQTEPVSPAPSSVLVENPQVHDRELRALLESLRRPAAGGFLKKVAAGNRSAPGIQPIYALVQCTPDISVQDCVTCLTRSIEFFPSCCGDRIGSGILRPSCTLRFENYRFFNASMVDQVPQEPLAPDGDEGNNRIFVIIFVPIAVAIVLAVGLVVFWRRRTYQKLKGNPNGGLGENVDSFSEDESQQYDLDTIRTATDNFSDANKLGEGGFGSVYKGILNRRVIAAKRMSSHSRQGDHELKTEIQLLAKLQHRNLVRLLGFCIQKGERILIYEFVQNGSLDRYIYDPIKSSYLDWEKRCRIIVGIAKGLLYLHEDSRLRIVHRDLKPSNVLLDGDMNPKIADFGMARLFNRDESQGNTNRIVGTYGYMAPEYVIQGLFSVKSDVFSFGVLVLEIISGHRSIGSNDGETSEDLLHYAWRNWREGTAAEVADRSVRASTDSVRDILRCIHMGLLCVQENAADRPTMANVVLMLSSSSVTMAAPSRPAFYVPSFDQELSVINESNSTSSATRPSVNEVSITQLDAR